MSDRRYEYIMAINRFGVLSVASRELGISQSTLTKFLQKEQKRLNIELFQKVDGKFVPTYAGEIYINRIEKINRICEDFENTLRDIRSDKKGLIRIGVCNSRMDFLTNSVIKNFKKTYPDVDIVIYELKEQKIEQMLLQMQLDVGIINVFNKKNEFVYHDVKDEKYLLAVNEKNDILSLARFAFENIYMMRVDALNDREFIALPKNTSVRRQMDEILLSNKIKYKISSYVNSFTSAIDCVKADVGICFLPRIATLKNLSDSVKYIEIENISNTYKLSILTRKGVGLSKIVKEFIEIFTRQYNLL